MNRLLLLLIILALAACATNPASRPQDARLSRCLALYAAADQAVAEHGTRPSSPRSLPDFPICASTGSWLNIS
ncbi:MAG: hypothetical protein HC808_15615 [Candidatus Competibacteraceae bacterium]|nr:hypothetical protein [Candidatus Competibacteraceae bacterium]